MSRVMNQLFLGSKIEEEIELSPESYLNLDPEYIEWSKKIDEKFNREFQPSPEETEGTIPF